MRPTEQAAGIYESESGPYMVAARDGRNYLLIWLDSIHDEDVQSGDIVLRDVHPASYRTDETDGNRRDT